MDYNVALTQEERNAVFDELTTMLGDDCPPREGFLDGRKDGLPGMRPRCVKFFNLVRMSVLRLELEELETPGGRDPTKTQPALWAEIGIGMTVRRRTMAALGVHLERSGYGQSSPLPDFLRFQKELAAWYGRSFWFTGNVLMLPFKFTLHTQNLT